MAEDKTNPTQAQPRHVTRRALTALGLSAIAGLVLTGCGKKPRGLQIPPREGAEAPVRNSYPPPDDDL